MDGGEEEETLATLRRKVVELEAALAHNHRGGREVEMVQTMMEIQNWGFCKENDNELFCEHCSFMYDHSCC